MYITPRVEMEKCWLDELSKSIELQTQEDKVSRIAQLKEIRKERDFRQTIAITSDEQIKAITDSIEKNDTAIHKLELANQVLRESRNLFIKEIADKFAEDNKFPGEEELKKLEMEQASQVFGSYGQWVTTSNGPTNVGSFINTPGIFANTK